MVEPARIIQAPRPASAPGHVGPATGMCRRCYLIFALGLSQAVLPRQPPTYCALTSMVHWPLAIV